MVDVYYEYEINGEKDYIFYPSRAAGILLSHDVLILGDYWWKEDWVEEAMEAYSLSVGCSGIFPFDIDVQKVKMNEIEDLYTEWLKHDIWGPIVFCIKKRKQRPLESVFNQIQELGIWDLNLFDYE